jgi:hypothetical protein
MWILKDIDLVNINYIVFTCLKTFPEGIQVYRFNVCSGWDVQRYGRSMHFDCIQNGLSVLIIICLLDAVRCVTTHTTNVFKQVKTKNLKPLGELD